MLGGLCIQSQGPSRAMEAGATQKSLAATSLIAKVNNKGNKFNTVNDISDDIKIKVLVLNARSIVKMEKRIELETYVKLHGYKIIAITESWATPDITDNELALSCFARTEVQLELERAGECCCM